MPVQTICVGEMDETTIGDDSDNSRPPRYFVIDEDDVGATSFRENTAIRKTGGSGRRRRYQVPGPSKWQHTILSKAKCRQQLRRIIIV